jgi:hypothetical protein
MPSTPQRIDSALRTHGIVSCKYNSNTISPKAFRLDDLCGLQMLETISYFDYGDIASLLRGTADQPIGRFHNFIEGY